MDLGVTIDRVVSGYSIICVVQNVSIYMLVWGV